MLNIVKNDLIQVIENPHRSRSADVNFLSWEATEPARHLHTSLDNYVPTPLIELSSFAKQCNVRSILVKDESKRFGLNAFKGLGGLYALFRTVCRELGVDYKTATLKTLQAPKYQQRLHQMEFVTATDGNHGKGISWAAGLLGCRSHVFMPQGSAEVRAQAIRDVGNAEVIITDLTYDDAVRYAAKEAEVHDWFLVQDTSWKGYEATPTWIIQGYTTMLYEALDQMKPLGYPQPTHIFLQAGVGAMAGGVLGALKCTYGENLPCVSIVEPDHVACIFESARYEDSIPHPAAGDNDTIMVGLNCGEPCQITWPILRDFADFYFVCPDSVAARGMRVLAAPQGKDSPIVSGESGGVTAGLVSLLLHNAKYADLRQRLKLDQNAVILLINTEGNTDPAGYFNIVYNGTHPMC